MFKLLKPALLLAAIGVMAIGMIGSGAWWSDNVTTSTTNAISSGTLSIDDAKVNTFSVGTITNMAPGDVTDSAVIIIENNGTVPLGWFGDLVVTGDAKLKEAIYINYALMEFNGGNWDEQDDNFITNGVGSGPYPGWYNTLAGMSPFHVVTLAAFDGNNGMGSAPYEFMGALKPGYSYQLTLKFGFAELADNTYQALGPLNLSFKIDSTQVTVGALNALHAGFGTNHKTWMDGQLANQD